jgi:DNA-nicking Smr family endonuclease
MKPPAEDVDLRLWSIVTATVRPLRQPRAHPRARAGLNEAMPASVPAPAASAPSAVIKTLAPPATPAPRNPVSRRAHPVAAIEPGRRRRLDRGRDPPAAVIDLHGLNQDQARATLTGFILRGWAEHRRTILVITGKGALGDGVLRRRVPEWLGEPPLRQIVAGLSEAHRRHGGEGAIYVALKRATVS